MKKIFLLVFLFLLQMLFIKSFEAKSFADSKTFINATDGVEFLTSPLNFFTSSRRLANVFGVDLVLAQLSSSFGASKTSIKTDYVSQNFIKTSLGIPNPLSFPQGPKLVCNKHNYKEFIYDEAKTDKLIQQTGKGCDLRGADLRGLDLRNAILWRADLSDAILIGTNFEGADLGYANLSSAQAQGANFTGANMLSVLAISTNFENAILKNTNFIGAYMQLANLTGVKAENAKFIDTDLENAKFIDSEVGFAIFHNANLVGVDFTRAEGLHPDQFTGVAYDSKKKIIAELSERGFTGPTNELRIKPNTSDRSLSVRNNTASSSQERATKNQTKIKNNKYKSKVLFCNITNYKDYIYSAEKTDRLIRKTYKGCDLRKANLKKASLQWSVLRKADLYNADLRGAIIHNTNLESAILMGAKLQGAKMRRTNLFKADLESAEMEFVDLREAKLQHASLRTANLRGANLKKAKLQNANLSSADLRGAILYKVKIENTKFKQAIYNNTTKFSPNFDPKKYGMIYKN